MQKITVSERAAAPTHTIELIQVPQELRHQYLDPVPSTISGTFIHPVGTGAADAKLQRIRRPKISKDYIGGTKPQAGKTILLLLTDKNARPRLNRSK
jgi:hypothetical protein